MRVHSLGREDPLGGAWQPAPVFLPGESHGRRSLAGCSPRGCKESDSAEVTEHTRCLDEQDTARRRAAVSTAEVEAGTALDAVGSELGCGGWAAGAGAEEGEWGLGVTPAPVSGGKRVRLESQAVRTGLCAER